MKTTLIIILLVLSFSIAKSQHATVSFSKYKYRDTHVTTCSKKDTSEIFYKGVSVGYLHAEEVKIQKVKKFNNYIIGHNLKQVALVYNELGQLGIKYFNPYKVVFVKGLQFDNAVQQMVEVDGILPTR